MLKLGKANLEIFSDTLIECARNDKDLIVVTSDSRGSGKLVPFAEKFPDLPIIEEGRLNPPGPYWTRHVATESARPLELVSEGADTGAERAA